ncbi:GYD domain-containing protein [Cryobacterium sp. TMT1-62]|uniref:GYD domain-containing protein n=1 Tax=Cryobacterium sp. TMT1-62 TaxID=1259240 RepID=UPI00106D8D57|nr:GYD domain-containing protein [Cryobacterium sp. TMT1-62]TFD30445.1 GYD domain-containing protein [Cryobacterium sp. TMT1-62]
MSKYLFGANYVGEGIRGLMREGGTGRREALVAALKSVGGSVESFYYAFGETGVLGVIEVPEPFDAAKKTPAYRAPGQ